MPNPASSLYKLLGYKVESVFGTPPGAAAAQLLRRVDSTIDLSKDTYASNEKRTDFQIADFRHGVRRVGGNINGELSGGTYKDFIAAALKRDFTALTAATGVGITVAGLGPTYTVTRSAGSFLTDGFKVGRVIRLTVGGLNALNSSKNLFVVALTATVATVMTLNGSALLAEGPITGCTVTEIGKTTYLPITGHTDKSFAFEHYYSDLVQSELFTGCKINNIDLGLPPTGMATIGLGVVGQDMTPGSAQYFTSPTAVSSSTTLSAVNGVLRIGGTTVASLTGLTLKIAPMFSGDAVVGSNKVPFLFAGKVMVTGQATAYFDSVALRDAFYNETELDILGAFTADNTAAAEAMCVSLPRVKLGGSAKDDAEGGLKQTIPFQALLNNAGGTGIATEKTTLCVQDSLA